MQTVFDILEWPQILAHLEAQCQTGYGRLLVNTEALQLADEAQVSLEIRRVEEAKLLILRFGDTTLQEPPDIGPTLKRLAKQGQVQSPEELGNLLQGLKSLRVLVRFVMQNRSREQTPVLYDAMESVSIPNESITRLEAVVSEKGELLDSASPEYARLKQRIRELQSELKQYMQSFVTRPTVARYLQEPIVTQREGRSVLPVKAEHKVDIPGIVHDTSATGSTLYIEPKGAVEQNNRIITLHGELDREIRRILGEISEALHPDIPQLEAFVQTAAQLDLLLAKARQSRILKANPVEVLSSKGQLHLRQARHPLLALQTENVVPNDIVMEPPTQVMLITGPNTGGKTVLLKLIGLFALMARCGLHLPVAEGSAMSLFSPILADIGDPQSIAQNLSTFSGHIMRLKSFLETEQLDNALILIDEICAGTDPEEGASLAKALLEIFYQRGAIVIVTTHIGELKVTAHQHPGYLNACVEFDTDSLSPTYRLLLGVPGTSNALNIAARLGITAEVIELARSQMSQPVADSSRLIESLELKNRALTHELSEARRLREEIQWEEEQMRKQLNRIEGEKQKTLQTYRQSLKDKLRRIEMEVDDLKKALQNRQKADSNALSKLSGRFRSVQAQTDALFSEETEKLYPHPGLAWESIQVGDVVESKTLGITGTVIEKHNARQELTLESGILKTTVPLSDITQKVGSTAKNKPQQPSQKGKVKLQPKSPSLECDVRGMTAEDALAVLDKFLDDAMVSGFQTVGVIHGLGTGVLKKAIRSHLKELPYIKKYGPAEARDGGDGKTVIEL